MTFSKRRIMFSLILLLVLVSGACGYLRISASIGDASGSSSYTESLGAKIDDQLKESTILGGSSLNQVFSGSGDKAQAFSVTNNAGDHAEVGFDIKNSQTYSGSYTLSPQTAKYAQATEALDVNNADSINTFANAYSRDGRAAEAIAMITKGSLIGYTNSAYATSLKATVTQKAKSASGVGAMWFGERAGIFDGNNLVVFAGDESVDQPNMPPGNDQLTAYSGSASALKDSVKKDSTIDSLSSSYISDGSVAWNKDANGNVLTSSDTVISITNGQISKYTKKATATRNSAQTSMKIGSAKGDTISSASNSVNLEGDNVNAKLDMGTGSLSGYSSTLTATKTSATALQRATSASGNQILFDEQAYNYERDHVGKVFSPGHPWIIDNGIVTNFAGSASATMNSAAMSETVGSISGNIPYIGPLASNKNPLNQASGYIVTSPSTSLEGYKITAYADKTSPSVTQSINVAAGPITIESGAQNLYDYIYEDFSLQSGSLKKYSDSASATSTTVDATQKATSASGSSIRASSNAQNSEGDMANSVIQISNGQLSGYSVTASTTPTSSKTTPVASTISTTETATLSADASNREEDNSNFNLNVVNGKIKNPKFYAWSQKFSAKTWAKIPNAYGTTAEIKSHAENTYPAVELTGLGDLYPITVYSGSADFAAERFYNNAFTNSIITTTATITDVDITTSGMKKTALILEPTKQLVGGESFFNSIGTPLKIKGYAVTSYSDSGVSWEKVHQLDEYTVSMIATHGVAMPTGIFDEESKAIHGEIFYKGDSVGLWISRQDGTDQIKTWTELKPYLTNHNDMIILDGCETFKLNKDGTRPGADAVKNAKVSGGFTGTIDFLSLIPGTKPTNTNFVNKFFERMCAGDTVSTANNEATKSVWYWQSMTLQGTDYNRVNYKLP